MNVVLETKEQIEPEFKTFTENRVKFSLKRLFWLVRKIIENLVTHILEKKYPKNSNLWYDPAKSRILMLSQLIENLYLNRKDFKAPKAQHQIETFNGDIKTLLKAMNSTVHNNHDYLTDRSDLGKFKLNKIIQNLIDIYSTI